MKKIKRLYWMEKNIYKEIKIIVYYIRIYLIKKEK
jgi:hypothetical protein